MELGRSLQALISLDLGRWTSEANCAEIIEAPLCTSSSYETFFCLLLDIDLSQNSDLIDFIHLLYLVFTLLFVKFEVDVAHHFFKDLLIDSSNDKDVV